MNLLSLLSVAVLVAAPTFIFIYALIAWQRSSKIGQWIREVGPQSHQLKKGTPSMGGLAIILGQTIGLLFLSPVSPLIKTYLIALWGAGLLGSYDDLLKIFKISSGISMRFKMGILTLLALSQSGLSLEWTSTLIPGYGMIALPGIIGMLLYFFAYTGTSNAVNLTDGLDGLVSSVLLSFWLIVLFLCQKLTPLCISWDWPVSDLILLSWVNLISLCSFLVFNIRPAFIFMGDSGALGLGAAIAATFCAIKSPLLLILFLFIPVIEALSVMIQVFSFKVFKKRIFKMAPLHHHFELSGYSENSIVIAFTTVNSSIGALSLWAFWEIYWSRFFL